MAFAAAVVSGHPSGCGAGPSLPMAGSERRGDDRRDMGPNFFSFFVFEKGYHRQLMPSPITTDPNPTGG